MSTIDLPQYKINTMQPLPYKQNNEIKKKVYDYIIVGGGPTGLTLAWILATQKKKILIVEAHESLGGCHRVERVDGLFTEHGPRVYSDAFLNFNNLLEKMGLKFTDIFTEFNFQTKYSFSINEYASFIYQLINLSINPNYSREVSIRKFMNINNFSEASKDYVERICRLTNGATTEKYTLFQFLQLINQQSFYKLYQPKLPNDKGLIFYWQNALKKTGKVDFLLEHEVTQLFVDNLKLINSIQVKNKKLDKGFTVDCKNCILAIPPKPLVKLLNNSLRAKDAFGKIEDVNNWSLKNSYFDYIPITVHFKQKVKLPKVQGFPQSDWGLAFVILSNYMKFNDTIEQQFSQTVISTCITFPDRKSSVLGKTANECEMDEIYNEVYRQLKLSFSDLPVPYRMITSPQVKRDVENRRWINYDTAFVSTTKKNNIDSHSEKITNLYSVGTHNGNSQYYFTSIESAVQNAIVFAKSILDENEMKEYEIQETFHITTIINMVLVILIFLIIIYIGKKLDF
jgi:hypothetical protein